MDGVREAVGLVADLLPDVPTLLLHLVFFSLPASSSSPRFASDLEQARPQTTGEEELQLQLALAMSREEAEKVGPWGWGLPPPRIICGASAPVDDSGYGAAQGLCTDP